MIAAAALTACGGGSGSDDDEAGSGALSVDLSGVAAKGLVANATVTVQQVGDNGQPGNTLASDRTDANGRYALKVTAQRGRPLVVTIAATNGTTHRDEVTNTAQPLPAGFRMRAAIANPARTTRLSVTPFTEMAVAAAQKATGGMTAANIARGNSVVAQILGFQPAGVAIKSTTDADTPDEQKQAVMLAAVSQMAASGQAGCTTGSAGEKTACVVDALGSATSTSGLQLETGGVNVGTQLGAAVRTVLQEPRLAGNVSGAVLTSVLSNLGCTGSSCTPTTPPPGPNPVATAITAAKDMFTEIRSDWNALFVSGKTSGIGDADAQATLFAEAIDDVQAPVEMMIKDTAALVMAADLYKDYMAGRTGNPGRGRAEGAFATDGALFGIETPAVGCTLYQDGALTTVTTAPANARFVACSTRYYYAFNGSTVTEYSHLIVSQPVATVPGQFKYDARARFRASGGSSNYLPTQSVAPRSGTFTAVMNASGQITRFDVAGELPAAFEMGGVYNGRATRLVGHRSLIAISGTKQRSATAASTSLSGSLKVLDAAGATLGTLTVSSAKLDEVTDAGGGTPVVGGELALDWSNPKASFSGSLAIGDSTWSKNRSSFVPTRLVLSGKLGTTTGGVRTDFVTGTFTLKARDFDKYDTSLPTSRANYVTLDTSFAGSVTAPSRPVLEATIGTSLRSYQDKPSAATLQYRSLVGGQPKLTIDATASVAANRVETLTIGNAAAGLTMTVRSDAAKADLLLDGNTKIGTLDLDSGILSFTDGTFVSVEIAR